MAEAIMSRVSSFLSCSLLRGNYETDSAAVQPTRVQQAATMRKKGRPRSTKSKAIMIAMEESMMTSTEGSRIASQSTTSRLKTRVMRRAHSRRTD